MKFDVFSSKFAQDIYKQKYSLDGQENWADTCKRVVDNVCGQLLDSKTKNEILDVMVERKFIPGGRYLYSSGREYHQVNNCFLLRAEDSREGWSDLMYQATSMLMTGGGIGVDYSRLRGEGALVKRTGGKSTGPIAAMKMVNELGRNIMQGGQRRCLPAGSRVHCENGLIPIEQVEIGTNVLTTSGLRRVSGKIFQGEQETITIKTQNGDLVCTPNHRVAVITSVTGEYKWVEAKDLKEGDRLYFTNQIVGGQKTQLPENDFIVSTHAHSLNRITIPELDTEISWLLGLIHGDGCVTLRNDNESGSKRHGRVQIACSKNHPEIKNKAVKVLERFGTKVAVKQGDGDLWNVVTHSVELAYYLSKIKKPKEELVVPEFIFMGTADIRAAFIAGLMDADGSMQTRPINIAAQIYPNYLKQIQELCSSLGVATRFKKVREAKGNWKTLYHLSVCNGKQLLNFKNTVGKFGHKCDYHIPQDNQQFSYSFPNDMVNSTKKFKRRSNGINTSIERIEKELGSLPFTPVKVKGIFKNKVLKTWDIEVEDKTEFFVNGYLVHNSAIWAGLQWDHPDAMKFIHIKDQTPEVRALKEKDFNFPVEMELTNISINYNTEFFIAMENSQHPKHELAKKIYIENCKQAFSTAEPGMAFNFRKDNESLRNACCEIVSEDNADKCNLGTVWMNRCTDKKDFKHVVNLATKFLICGGIYSDVPNDKVREVGNKNNRIGLGLGGMHEWLMLRGEKYQVTPELHKWLAIYRDESDSAAFITSRELNVSVPKGIRAIAPTGTIGIIAETTTGIEPLFCKAYLRRYYKDGKWLSQYVVDGSVKRLQSQGVAIENIQDSYDLSFKQRVKFQADVQNYVDMAISSTCNMPSWGSETNNEESVEKNAKDLLYYAKRLRGFTVYPDGCRGGQPLTRVDLNEALSKEGTVFEEQERECLNGVCGL